MSLRDKFRGVLASRWSWLLVAFLIGGDLGWQAHRWWAGRNLPVRFQMHGGFGAGPGDEGDEEEIADPFEQMRRMQEKMLRQFAGRGGLGGQSAPFGGGGQVFEMNSADFSEREDEKFVYYDLDVKGMTPQDLKVNVEDGQVSVSGRLEKKTDEGGSPAIISSSFQRSFPVPPNVVAEKFELEQEGAKIVIKFPKR